MERAQAARRYDPRVRWLPKCREGNAVTMSPTESARQLRGQCQCGAVQYRVADEFVYALNCHCSRCRQATGSAFKPTAGIPHGKLAVVQGADRLMIIGDERGHDARCRACGSFLYSRGS